MEEIRALLALEEHIQVDVSCKIGSLVQAFIMGLIQPPLQQANRSTGPRFKKMEGAIL